MENSTLPKQPSSNNLTTAKATIQFKDAEGSKKMRVLVAVGVLLLLQFFWWFADSDHVGYAPLFWLLTFSLCYKMLRMLQEWYHYVHVQEPIAPVVAATAPLRTVDMLTTACPGEPHAMIIRTLEAMVAVRYPHTNYLCDEGDDPVLRAACDRLGVVHVTRILKVHAKAGNINNALQQATGELCVVLDPDHEVTPDFLDQVVPYFEDPTLGYAQVVQAYGNQQESFVALGAAEQTYHFYGPLMMGMNSYNTVQAIGANCTFRRTALDSIGGHAAGLTEDMHTAMRMHAHGWKSIYVPVVVSRGLVPSTLGGFYMQQLKWARGTFDLLFHVYPKLFRHFTWRQRLHYLMMPLYFLSGLVALIDIAVPVASLVLLKFPWHLSLPEFALHMLPVATVALLIRYNAQQWLREPHEPGLHLAGGILRIATWWVYSLGLIYTFFNVKVPYIPTPKEGQVKNEWLLSLPNLLLAALSVGAAAFSLQVQGIRGPYTKLMATLALINAFILLVSVLMAQHALIMGLRSFMWSVPILHTLKRKFDQTLAAGAGIIATRLRSGSIAFAAGLAILHLLATAGLVLMQWRENVSISEDYIWAHTGYGELRIGRPLAAKQAASLPVRQAASNKQPAIIWTKTSSSARQVISIELPTNTPPQVPVGVIEDINQRHNIPLLTWVANEAPDKTHAFKQQVLRIVKHENQLLLRPIIRAKSPSAYRAAWQQLVKSYRASGDTTLVWVWTPPRPDSIAAYFPGSAYVTWITSDCTTQPEPANTTLDCYNTFRQQVAIQIEMQSKPVLLFAPQFYSPTSYQWAKKATERYPEIKAVVFSANNSSDSPSKNVSLTVAN
ncbi:glycosyltransferase [Hymenobacter tibetensis]|uniref:Glycosyltransferase n=1 Tax=Hymenobacter tibetensis TaxID=497967 RepID=A0ABY4CVQ9_9BACT|nr:cellulose synthase catalytic subunit [Hymenobacter tibetensis]UOG74358.1 glycosyltransferase [Hymenobacter tibetensis]